MGKVIERERKVKLLDEQRTDILKIDIRAIEPDFSWNPREDYGDLEELAQSIIANGVKKPLEGRRNPDDKERFLLKDGFRRFKACMLLMQRGDITELRVPFILETRGYSEEDRLIDTVLSNNTGKPLTMLEFAGVVKRISNFGMDDKEIGNRLSKSKTFISNCYSLLEAPEAVKNLIRNEHISPTLVLDIFRKEKNFDEAVKLIKSLEAKLKINDGEKEKITAKDVEIAKGKINSVKIFRKMFTKTHKDKIIRDDKAELYEFCKKLITGKITEEELEQTFFM